VDIIPHSTTQQHNVINKKVTEKYVTRMAGHQYDGGGHDINHQHDILTCDED